MAYNVYSFPDVKAVIKHSDVGQCSLHQSGMGKITVSAAGDLASHTTTADGYVIVNRLKTTNGTITIEVPQGSVADWFLRKWARWARSLQNPSRIALGVLTIQDTVGGKRKRSSPIPSSQPPSSSGASASSSPRSSSSLRST